MLRGRLEGEVCKWMLCETPKELFCALLQEMMKEDVCCKRAAMDSEDELFLSYT